MIAHGSWWRRRGHALRWRRSHDQLTFADCDVAPSGADYHARRFDWCWWARLRLWWRR